MSKYQNLKDFLKKQSSSYIPMTFLDIEGLIEGRLPMSARKHRAWWSNNPSNSVITHAWLEAGYKSSQVDLEGGTLTFVRAAPDGPAPSRRIFGALSGMVSVAKGHDLTEPSAPEWGRDA